LRYGLRNKYHKEKLSRLLDVSDFPSFYLMIRANGWFADFSSLFSENYLESVQLDKTNIDIFDCLYSSNITNLWQHTQELEMKTYMQWRLLRDTDAMSMHHSLEVRVPLLDDYLVDYIFQLPIGWGKKLGWPKKLLVNSMKDILPSFILNQPKKGFQLPMESWMKTTLQPIVEDVFSKQSVSERGVFNHKKTEQMHKLFLAGKYPYESIWKFVVLELWMRKNNIEV